MLFDLTPLTMAILAMGLLVAAYVRGYSGFGFSALFIAWASLWTNPVPLVPVVFSCEILMTAFQAKGIRGHVEWRRVGWLIAGAAVALPLSIYVIASASEDSARLAVSIIIMVMSLILLSGWSFKAKISDAGHGLVGAVSGLCNGAGVGGLPVVAFLAAQPVEPARFRATMIVYLTALDAITLPIMYAVGLITWETFCAAALAMPIHGLGLWLGGRRFSSASPEGFRRLAIILLFTLASLGLLRATLF